MINASDITDVPCQKPGDIFWGNIQRTKNAASEILESGNLFSNDDLIDLWQIILWSESDKIDLSHSNWDIRQLLYSSMMHEVWKIADSMELIQYPKSPIKSLQEQKIFITELLSNIRALLYKNPNENFLKQGKTQEEFNYTRRWSSWPDMVKEHKTINCVFAAMIWKHIMDKVWIKCRFCFLRGHTANIITLSDWKNYYMDFMNSISSKLPIWSIRMEKWIRKKIKNVTPSWIWMGKVIEKVLITNNDSDVLEGVLWNIWVMRKELSEWKDSNWTVKAIHDKYILKNPNFFKIARFFKSELFKDLKAEL
ncbi:MAG: hypothetical protein ACD_3C00054G0025 [uncultured bacterium (gcode 4)]|uniref:Uncharacterized protein n=1 Tax=uncultured bacterium (gcode 4) TaxID=1234023 RepID=K2GYF3_9BACT|nr:MAG: hypothetical protein ACD_3C00054G0025 [uncultured bacterium (gcode 4)]